MNQLNENTRRIGGLLLEVLVLVFVFSGSCLDVDVLNRYKHELTIKTSPIPQMAFRHPNSSLKSHNECNDKPNNSHDRYTFFLVPFGNNDIIQTSGLDIFSSMFNSFYTHLTAQAP